jgi:DNA-binding NtrC family response regulator
LYYRLNVVPIHLAPLRERLADIVPLAEFFLRQAKTPTKQLTAAAAARLIAHAWPGNVRELKNAMERVAILCRGVEIDAGDFDFLAVEEKAGVSAEIGWTDSDLPTAVARLERHMIAKALRETDGNRSEAARRLGIHRQLLYTKAQKYGIEVAELSEDQTDAVAKPDSPR